jgi:phosphonatase-like hydrolase
MSKYFIDKTVKLLVCDMAGTTVNERGIVYKTLYETIKGYDIYIEPEEMKSWYGINKTQVLEHFLDRDTEYKDNKEAILPQMLNSFKKNLKNNYSKDGSISLIDNELPQLFNEFRSKGIKIALNSGFSVDIQRELIKNLKMDTFIDEFISSEEVPHGRPEPYMIEELMKRCDISDSNQVIKIGDSINDILEGKNAKCYASIGVLSGAENMDNLINNGADAVIESVMSLKYK